MANSTRMLRVNELLKREIANLLEFEKHNNGALISISKVDTAPNLRTADVYICILGGNENSRSDAIKYLKSRKNYIQKKLAKNVNLKYTPVLTFSFDKNVDAGDNVLSILSELDNEDNEPNRE